MTKADYSQLKKFFSQFPTQKISKNSIVFKPGDKIENIYFMKSGYVRAYTKIPFGENTLNVFKPLFLFSVIHFFTNSRNNLYLQAITSAETYIIPKQEFKSFLDKNPEMSAIIMDFFFSSLLLYITNQGGIINGSAINKVASVLVQMVRDYGDVRNGQLIVNFPATHRMIASLVGLTRETTSVQMSRLQKLGIISTKRTQFTVHNQEKLKKLASFAE